MTVSAGVKITIPLDEHPDTVRERSIWPKADRTFQIRAVRTGFQDVAGLHRQEFADRRTADRLLDLPDELDHFHRLTVADL